MSFELESLTNKLADFLVEPATSGNNGSIIYRLNIGELPAGRAISFAELIIPKGFPETGIARIRLSSDAELRVPHVERDGFLCIDGDPGPGRGLDGDERVLNLVGNFFRNFLVPWCNGDLDGDFSKEPQNYWGVHVARLKSNEDTARGIWTVDEIPRKAQVREGLLLHPARFVVASDIDNQFVQRLIASLGFRAKQRVRVIIADIPISHSFVPCTWPRNIDELLGLLQARLKPPDFQRFNEKTLRRRRSREHRIALFRSHEGGFGFVLPGGPPIIFHEGNHQRARRPPSRIQPISVDRIDPMWTVGRDQISQVSARQQKHVVVLGAGALGSPVIEQLAKVGIGKITIIDSDILEAANLGRHLLGVPFLEYSKAVGVAQEVSRNHPSCIIKAVNQKAEAWLSTVELEGVDTVLDLTGEPSVRWYLNEARRKHSCKMLVGWMEPFVAAAHVCALTSETLWFRDEASTVDRLNALEAIDWPDGVLRKVPGCSSRFQAYTSANAAYAVALVTENALLLIDEEINSSKVVSWVRGRQFLDKQWPNLEFRDWAKCAEQHAGIVLERAFI
jgi:molybdopterin/thiamine biosynthesis adenylyltransferase